MLALSGAAAAGSHNLSAEALATIPDSVRAIMGQTDPGCLSCHTNIGNANLNMGFELPCTYCHGGDPLALTMEDGHVQPTEPVINDNTTPGMDYDLPYQQFVNPSNLRVVEQTCGVCHWEHVQTVKKSMMATTAGHYAGGLYQNGVVDTKTPIYSNFDIVDDDGDVPLEFGAVASLTSLPSYDPTADQSLVATHYAAVPPQGCARCHLWSRGKGYRGAENADGVYRADGCAACHMIYANDGLSQSPDTMIDHTEKGHPINHIITRQIPTSQCLHCHHRGARIGLNFTGRAQMPPRLPSGPGVPGTTDERFNSNYHISDPETNPSDLHHDAGMHCIDCHTRSEIMGDGNIWGHMDQATKIECRTCHGLPNQAATFLDNDGVALTNVADGGSGPVLTSKVTGAEHPVTQIMDIVNPDSPTYNPRAACAMNELHLREEGGLECYACHTSWVPNCFGCHFERDEQEMGRNLLTREWEVGKIATSNKIYESLKHFAIGPNSEGRTAPYIVGCHPIADVTAPDGSKKLDFVMPVTANGISGLAHDAVQPHTVRGAGEVRECEECHRSPPTLGLGSGNYAIARTNAYLATDNGVLVYDRWADPAAPTLVETLSSGPIFGMSRLANKVEGTSDFLYLAKGTGGVEIYDLTSNMRGGPVATIPGIDAIGIARAARYVNVVVAGEGIRIYDNADPVTTSLVGTVAIPGALSVIEWGIHLLVAAGNSGFYIVDVSNPQQPEIVARLTNINAQAIHPYAHFQKGSSFAVRAYVADPDAGVHVIDLLPDFADAKRVAFLPLPGAVGLDTYTRYLPTDGVTPSREHDYLYVAAGSSGLQVYDITLPDAIQPVGALGGLGGTAVGIDVHSQLAPPGVDDYGLLTNSGIGLQLINVSDPTQPTLVTTLPATTARQAFVDVQQLDRFVDEQGQLVKDNSHPFTGNYSREDMVRILSAPILDCPSGACCFTDGTCQEITEANCFLAGGEFNQCGSQCGGDSDDDGIANACEAPTPVPASARGGLLLLILLLFGTAAVSYGISRPRPGREE